MTIERTPQENVKELEKLLKYSAEIKLTDLESMNILYNFQFDPNEFYYSMSNPLFLDFFLRFFSIGILTRMSELLEEKKRKEELN